MYTKFYSNKYDDILLDDNYIFHIFEIHIIAVIRLQYKYSLISKLLFVNHLIIAEKE